MRLEPELWQALSDIREREAQDKGAPVRQVEAAGHIGGRTSAVRIFILNYFRMAATEIGHAACGGRGLIQQRQEVGRTRFAA